MAKNIEKNQAVDFRKQGMTYSEILKKIPIAKSTLSLWLQEVGLSVIQKQNITEKRLAAGRRGGLRRRLDRINSTKKIKDEAEKELGILGKNTFWMVGAALYWAEGNKQKENNVASPVRFSNSDPEMIKFFRKWLIEFCEIKSEEIKYELYIHETSNIEDAKKYWSEIIVADKSQFTPVRLKKGNSVSYRKNKGKGYFGLIRMNVKQSTNLNRRIMGWVEGICKQF
ncbi:MAG: hypothetical protein Q7S24_02370 [bacterium]|nr:hypothetical protein [bacterium]